jgi:hypothetical protein
MDGFIEGVPVIVFELETGMGLKYVVGAAILTAVTVPVAVVVVVVGRTIAYVTFATVVPPVIVVVGNVTELLPLVKTQLATNVEPTNIETPVKVVPPENTGGDDNVSEVVVMALADNPLSVTL